MMIMAVVGGCQFAVPTQAQNVPDTITAAPPLCLRGRTLTRCKVFFITEIALHLDQGRAGAGGDPYLSRTYGLMINLTDHDAVGGGFVHVGLDNGPRSYGRRNHGRAGWLLRYRRWIVQDGVGLDLSLGRVSTPADDPEGRRHTAELGLSLGDVSGVFGQASETPDGAHPSAGFKLGSWPGLILGLVSHIYASIPQMGN
jgi:hypothetical protein